jgi:hypothetical protein
VICIRTAKFSSDLECFASTVVSHRAPGIEFDRAGLIRDCFVDFRISTGRLLLVSSAHAEETTTFTRHSAILRPDSTARCRHTNVVPN